jgi:threonine 3-dehydrogenase
MQIKEECVKLCKLPTGFKAELGYIMRKKIILITGANGEIGHGLINALHANGMDNILALDLHPISEEIEGKIQEAVIGNILDKNLLEQIKSEYEIITIYHLAALLSTRAEFAPQMAHEVNVTGTLNLLTLAVDQAKSQGETVNFFLPSSIAVYGMDHNKDKAGAITESGYCHPETMYGCNKLYCENLGIYHANYYHRLADDFKPGHIDFRSIRFPGIISAMTIPTGGTSDFLPEMIHAAAQNTQYNCFVRNDTRMPFMVMPDAILAILNLMDADKSQLSQHVYNISAFNPSAGEFADKVRGYFPHAEISTSINGKRQSIVDSWPAQVDDSAARTDWNWSPKFDLNSAFEDYLIPQITKRYVK